jgi:hypothetical protein
MATGPPVDRDPVLLPAEAAGRLRRSVKTLEFWRYQGRGPVLVRLGYRRVGYLTSDIEAFLEAQRQGGDASQ